MADSIAAPPRPTFLAPSRHIDAHHLAADRIAQDAARFRAAAPGPHLIVENLFSAALLEAVADEFGAHADWRVISNGREHIHRSLAADQFGPATESYLAAANSARFLSYLQALTGLPHLIADVTAERAGLHETKRGGFLVVHCDFASHRANDLQTALVVLTYLNRDWKEEYAGNLEMWTKAGCVTSIAPLFGRTLIFAAPHRILHGHPAPLAVPEHVSRRSIATYYYINPRARTHERRSTRFLRGDNFEHVRYLARRWLPQSWRVAGSSVRKRLGVGARRDATRGDY